MIKIIKESYLFIIVFIIILLKEPIYSLINIKNNFTTNEVNCNILENNYKKLLDFNNIDLKYNTEYTNTYIIYKDVYNYLEEITIRGGIDKNFNKNAVIYNNTLLGLINKVNSNSSVVKLLTNKNSKIAVKINDEIGILESIENKLYVTNISNYSNIEIGDHIYTSGLSNLDENIYIGKVKNIILDKKNIEKRILVDYNLDIKNIDYVTVLGDFK